MRKQKIDNSETAKDIGERASLRKNVEEATGNLKAWSLVADAATIDYGLSSVGA